MLYNCSMKFSRQSYINTHRDSWVEVNLEHLAQNVKQIKSKVLGAKLMAVVKADAYGHGAVMCAPTMLASGVDMLGVASIDEGLNLRDAHIDCDILVLGAVPVWSVDSAVENNLAISIFSKDHITACKSAFDKIGKKAQVHIKLDTGMNRIGVDTNAAVNFIKEVQKSEFVELKGIFTHLANAEKQDKTKLQLDLFDEIINQIDTKGLLIHALNTAGILNYKNKFDVVRSGIALYGLFPDDKIEGVELKQVLSLKGRIVHIHQAQKDEGVSYGHTFVADEEIKIATIPIGYADGVPRSLSNRIYAMLNGNKIKQIGNITMDQMMFDITGMEATEGDIITLLDTTQSIDDWAKILGTINYELTCRMKVRLPRVYTR